MKLRIVAGHLKGRAITLGGRLGACRPTAERQRESVVQIVGGSIDGARVADLCAGSGAMGFEMLSRGAREAHFVEADRGRARAIEGAAVRLGVAPQVRVWAEDIRRFLGRGTGPYDIVYFDPPYGDDALAELAPRLVGLLAAGGVLIHERARHRQAAALSPGGTAERIDTRTYGMTVVDFYTVRTPAPPDATVAAPSGKGEQYAHRAVPGNV
jgi:16S rRNA (guanine966-N2)-methyltransferase